MGFCTSTQSTLTIFSLKRNHSKWPSHTETILFPQSLAPDLKSLLLVGFLKLGLTPTALFPITEFVV